MGTPPELYLINSNRNPNNKQNKIDPENSSFLVETHLPTAARVYANWLENPKKSQGPH